MGRAYDPARATRERLLMLERREKARAQARAVTDGVAESVALSRSRGAAFAKEPGARDTPYRRQCGLDWLAKKGRLTARQLAAGERYGECYRLAAAEASIGSTLEVQPGSLPGGPSLAQVLRQGAGRKQAATRLALYRRQLLEQADLIGACDRICGQELTPREAGGGEREGLRLEAVLKVALDILAAAPP
ncbi:hypothetical protein DJ021_14090 [Phenylobacterium hankyongense]|uniref:Uncharacterized protein n=1 Tax=Phenylobacterium hankyongense TaxID=1813876 RepID=A0A328B1T4_9CAUL|nr:hypothetical protein [Phenylobacterium hankyongense]RAK60859.1 hypothetical protein DJ021_14090 [Phenylobacterium hankyongense]